MQHCCLLIAKFTVLQQLAYVRVHLHYVHAHMYVHVHYVHVYVHVHYVHVNVHMFWITMVNAQ